MSEILVSSDGLSSPPISIMNHHIM